MKILLKNINSELLLTFFNMRLLYFIIYEIKFNVSNILF